MYVAEITPPSVRGMFTMSTKAKVGTEREAISSLNWLRGNDADVSDEAADIMPQFKPSASSRFMNQYFLLIAFLQLWSIITPVNPASTWGPLILIFEVSATKEVWDDYKRFKRKTFMLVVLFVCARMLKCPVILC